MRLSVEQLDSRVLPSTTPVFPTYLIHGIEMHDVQSVVKITDGPITFSAPDWASATIVPGLLALGDNVTTADDPVTLAALHPALPPDYQIPPPSVMPGAAASQQATVRNWLDSVNGSVPTTRPETISQGPAAVAPDLATWLVKHASDE